MSDNYFKIAVVGGGGVGKSCLTIRFLRDMFIEKYDPTIEESYRKDVMVDEQAVTLEILDTAGQEEYTSIRDRYLRKQDGFACVFSLTSKATVGEVKRAFLHIRRVKDEDEIVGVLIANKCDISEEERAVSSDVGKDLAREFNVPYVECSAKTGENVHDSFYTIVREIRKARKNNIGKPVKKQSKKKNNRRRRRKKKKSLCLVF
ncbi:ras-like protein [Anaeramoeba flamelloides]|uniref:Ras-like protein n=1 Tax=Anaeramoeba flamelloides TaxID=1746091 RepID=A0AAV7YAQ1_9EUKA|nr:ras-like protein [Anaeramoeba flamelloides]KAJ6236895.1 ras-like protein [Anaeramoeba flamelloides]